jgi:hypothetical protein
VQRLSIALGLLLSGAGCPGDRSNSLTDAGSDAGSNTSGCASPTGQLSVSPLALDFGATVVRSVNSQTILLSNCTEKDVVVTPGLQGPQAALFQFDETGPFTLPAGAALDFTTSYAPLMPSALDVATLILALNNGGALQVALQGIALQSGLKTSPLPLYFAFVQPGVAVTLPLHLTNVGNLKITVKSIDLVDPGAPLAYTIARGSWPGGDLAPGATQDVDVTFTPLDNREYDGELDISSTDATSTVPVALRGYGGGAIISCSPMALDFGVAAVTIGSALPVICTNVGSDVPNHPEAGVILTTLPTDNAAFSAQVDSASSFQASPLAPLAAGQSVQLDVIYAPAAVTPMDVGTLTINSNATDGTSLSPPAVALTGEAISELPCAYSVTPTTVQFGETRPSSTTTSGFTLTNVGTNECLVTGLELGAETQAAFTLLSGPVISQRLSPPGPAPLYPTFLQVNLAFTPQQTGSYSGTVEFTVSDPTAPHQAVNLSGDCGNSCFALRPTDLDFGTVGLSNGQFCATETRQLVGINDCTQAVTIQSATLAGSSAYSFIAGQMPLTVPQGATSMPIEIGFKPIASGSYDATVLLQTDLQTNPFGAGVSGKAIAGAMQLDRFVGHSPSVDILWVMDIDDDDAERDLIAKQASTFIDALNNAQLDYQIGVTTSDWCPSGIQGTSENGRLLPCPGCKIDGTQPMIVTPQDETAAADLQSLIEIGTNTTNACSPDEQFFDAAYEAVVATTNQGWNAALIRPNAYLAIITANGDNEDDNCREQTPQWYANELLTVKGLDHPELFSWSYISPSMLGSPGGNVPFLSLPDRISSLLQLVGGVAVDTEQSDWTSAVNRLWNIISNDTQRYTLSGTPDPASIAVYLDGPPPGQSPDGGVPGLQINASDPNGLTNWSYDSTSNTLNVITMNLMLSPTDTLYVQYTLLCPASGN